MPNYNTNTSVFPINAVYPGDQILLFNAEQPATPQASVQVALANAYENAATQSVSVEILFSGTPGAFSLQPQVADTDADAFYVAEGSAITAVTNNFARVEFPNIKTRFFRVLLSSRTNAVNLTVKLTR
jgi:hypothetical protein